MIKIAFLQLLPSECVEENMEKVFIIVKRLENWAPILPCFQRCGAVGIISLTI